MAGLARGPGPGQEEPSPGGMWTPLGRQPGQGWARALRGTPLPLGPRSTLPLSASKPSPGVFSNSSRSWEAGQAAAHGVQSLPTHPEVGASLPLSQVKKLVLGAVKHLAQVTEEEDGAESL